MNPRAHSLLAAGGLMLCVLGCSQSHAQPESRGLYMDVHNLGAGKVTADAVAEAHAKDLEVQGQYGVSFLRYWVDEANGKVYCLSHAPNADAVVATHRQAHGLLPDAVGEVSTGE